MYGLALGTAFVGGLLLFIGGVVTGNIYAFTVGLVCAGLAVYIHFDDYGR